MRGIAALVPSDVYKIKGVTESTCPTSEICISEINRSLHNCIVNLNLQVDLNCVQCDSESESSGTQGIGEV